MKRSRAKLITKVWLFLNDYVTVLFSWWSCYWESKVNDGRREDCSSSCSSSDDLLCLCIRLKTPLCLRLAQAAVKLLWSRPVCVDVSNKRRARRFVSDRVCASCCCSEAAALRRIALPDVVLHAAALTLSCCSAKHETKAADQWERTDVLFQVTGTNSRTVVFPEESEEAEPCFLLTRVCSSESTLTLKLRHCSRDTQRETSSLNTQSGCFHTCGFIQLLCCLHQTRINPQLTIIPNKCIITSCLTKNN